MARATWGTACSAVGAAEESPVVGADAPLPDPAPGAASAGGAVITAATSKVVVAFGESRIFG
eukprot:13573545-Alexandrium_andersonii.AAC.1